MAKVQNDFEKESFFLFFLRKYVITGFNFAFFYYLCMTKLINME